MESSTATIYHSQDTFDDPHFKPPLAADTELAWLSIDSLDTSDQPLPEEISDWFTIPQLLQMKRLLLLKEVVSQLNETPICGSFMGLEVLPEIEIAVKRASLELNTREKQVDYVRTFCRYERVHMNPSYQHMFQRILSLIEDPALQVEVENIFSR